MRAGFVVFAAVTFASAALARTAPGFRLASSAFPAHGPIPVRYTCDGAGLSPPLAWSGTPAGTRTYALTVSDPDAPDPAHPTHTFIHWVVFNLPAKVHALETGASTDMPAGTGTGLNGAGRPGFTPPCPPIGRHRYFFRLYALDAPLALRGHPNLASLTEALRGHVLAEAVLVGTYAHSH